MASGAPPSVDLTSIQWRMPEWVQSMGGLRTENGEFNIFCLRSMPS